MNGQSQCNSLPPALDHFEDLKIGNGRKSNDDSMEEKAVKEFKEKVEKYCQNFNVISADHFKSKVGAITSLTLQSVQLSLDDSDSDSNSDDDDNHVDDFILRLKNKLNCLQNSLWAEQKIKNEEEIIKVKAKMADTIKYFEDLLPTLRPLEQDLEAQDLIDDFSSQFNFSDRSVRDVYVKELRREITKIQNIRHMQTPPIFSKETEYKAPGPSRLSTPISEKKSGSNSIATENKIHLTPTPKVLPPAPVKVEKDLTPLIEKVRSSYRNLMLKNFKIPIYYDPKRLTSLHTTCVKQSLDLVLGQYDPKNDRKYIYAVMESSFKEFESKNKMNAPTSFAIGIDLGTTYSCVGVYINGKVEIIPNEQGNQTTPSYLAFKSPDSPCDPDHVVVGEQAKNQAHTCPERTIYEVKRLIGRKFDDPVIQNDIAKWPFKVVEEGGVPKILIGESQTFHPEEISSQILLKMKQNAENYLKEKVTRAVISVPAYFTDGQRQATKTAAEKAGLEVLRILNEPTAAAIAYNLNWVGSSESTNGIKAGGSGQRKGLVFDMGGGTFDVAIFSAEEGKIEILKVGGDSHLGGVDMDNLIVDYCITQFQAQHGVNLTEGRDSLDHKVRSAVNRKLMRLKNVCEQHKRKLSTEQMTAITVDCIHQQLDLDVQLTRQQFESLITPLIQKSLNSVDYVLTHEAKLQKSDINEIVLVGGTTRIPLLRKYLKDYFGGKTLSTSIDPDEAIAIGTAFEAAVLNGAKAEASGDIRSAAIAPKGMSIKDVMPMSLGVEVEGGEMCVLIKKQSQVPVSASSNYTTTYNNQTSVQIVIYEGEDKQAKKNDMVGEFYLNGIPAGLAGRYTVKVTMTVSMEGIIQVTATCEENGVEKKLTVRVNKKRMAK